MTRSESTLKVTALTSGRNHPSSRFRVRQSSRRLQSYGIEVNEHYPLVNKYLTKRLAPLGMLARLPGVLAARTSAITWLERELVPEKFTLERFAGTRRVLDVDDAIWLNKPGFSEKIAHSCSGVIAGNEFIAAHYAKLGLRVWNVPTSIDTDVWRPAAERTNRKWTIGWMGSSSNLKYLHAIEAPLADFLASHSDAQLLIVCDRPPAFAKLPSDSVVFQRWSATNEVRSAQAMDVGLMPLADDEWARGKCAFKMISYLAVGVPAIASPVGVAHALIEHSSLAASSEGDWFGALERLYDDPSLARALGARGRKIIEERYSVKRNAGKLASILREVAAE